MAAPSATSLVLKSPQSGRLEAMPPVLANVSAQGSVPLDRALASSRQEGLNPQSCAKELLSR